MFSLSSPLLDEGACWHPLPLHWLKHSARVVPAVRTQMFTDLKDWSAEMALHCSAPASVAKSKFRFGKAVAFRQGLFASLSGGNIRFLLRIGRQDSMHFGFLMCMIGGSSLVCSLEGGSSLLQHGQTVCTVQGLP